MARARIGVMRRVDISIRVRIRVSVRGIVRVRAEFKTVSISMRVILEAVRAEVGVRVRVSVKVTADSMRLGSPDLCQA